MKVFMVTDRIKRIISDKIKNKRLSDLIFLIIFLIILLIPVSHINLDDVSDNERRDLSPYKPLYSRNSGINFNYPDDFNNWINDRFLGREHLLSLYAVTNCYFNVYSCQIDNVFLFKNNNYMYSGGYKGLPELKEKHKKDILKTYADNVNRFEQFCKENNTKLYILIAPRQKDFFEYKIFRKNMPDYADEVIDYLRTRTNVNIIYPQKAMLEVNKESPVYFKTDHHWTKKGAYTGYYELMQHIKNDFPDIQILSEESLYKYHDNRVQDDINDDFHIGSSLRRMHLPDFYVKKILDTNYLYYKNPKSKDLHAVENLLTTKKHGRDYQFYYPLGADKKVMVIGNSFIGNFMEFIPYSFKYTLGYIDNPHKMYFYKYEKAFKEYKPDILIILLHTTNMYRLLNLYENEYSIDK